MRLGLHIGYWGLGMTAQEQLELVLEAEQLGYDSVWTAEAYGSDAATILAWLAGQTERVKLGSAIFQMPGRSAAMTAMTAATIDQLSDGRMLLGIGSSGPQVAEGWHGQRFGKQLQRTREYIAVVRMALARERVVFDGETLQLPLPDGPGKALKLTIAPVQERMPIYLAAIGPKNTTLGAEIADGWIPTLFSPEHVGEFRPLLEEGFARAGGGKGFDDFDIAPTVNVFVTDDVESARDAMRPFVALYVGGMGSRKQNFYNAARAALRVRGRRARGPGPVSGRQEGGGDGGAPGRAARPRLAVRAARRRPRSAGGLPRRGRRDADGRADVVVVRGPA